MDRLVRHFWTFHSAQKILRSSCSRTVHFRPGLYSLPIVFKLAFYRMTFRLLTISGFHETVKIVWIERIYCTYSNKLFVWLYLKGFHNEFGQMGSKSVFCFLQLFKRTRVRYKIMRKRSNPFNKLEDEFKEIKRLEKDFKKIVRIFSSKKFFFSKIKKKFIVYK